MKIYARMLAQFFLIEKRLRSLANKERSKKPDFADFIDQLLKSMTKNLIDNFTRDISSEKFEELTGITLPRSINKSELLLFFLIFCGIPNRDIAVLLKTSTASIRTRKSLLKNKLKEAGIDISFFESATLSPNDGSTGVKYPHSNHADHKLITGKHCVKNQKQTIKSLENLLFYDSFARMK